MWTFSDDLLPGSEEAKPHPIPKADLIFFLSDFFSTNNPSLLPAHSLQVKNVVKYITH